MTNSKSPGHKINLRRTNSSEYWYDVIFGGLLTCLLLFGVGSLLLIKMNLNEWQYPYTIACAAIVAYYQWRDDNFTIIKTGLSQEKNFDLVTASLDQLNWTYDKTSKKIDLRLNKYLLKFLEPSIIVGNNNIYINFKYHSTTKTGRLPFYFGISSYLQWKFKKAVMKLMLQQTVLY